jgi:HSP20 family protein
MDHLMDGDMDVFRRMERDMQRMADEAMRAFLSGEPPPDHFWQPRVDVYETPDDVLVKLELAGVDSGTLRVHLSADGRQLGVSGERSEDDSERASRVRCYRLEIYYGPFDCRVQLPSGLRFQREAITARYSDGVLTVRLPKAATQLIPVAQEPEEEAL